MLAYLSRKEGGKHMIGEFWNNSPSRESVQAECRRLEAAGYKIMYCVKSNDFTHQRLRPITQYDLGSYDFMTPGIRAFR